MYNYNLALKFQENVERHPHWTAIRFDKWNSVCYGELNSLANRQARRLRDVFEVSRGDVVCIAGNKSLYSFASILACLKLGAIYSIFDVAGSRERNRRIFDTCRPKVTLNDTRESVEVPKWGYSHANLEETHKVTGADPAYIMFTSGSTGFPKGAVMTHANALNFIQWCQQTFEIYPDDILTGVNSLYFDNSVFDIYASLFNEACLVPFTRSEVCDPKHLVDKIDELGCTLWFSVPSLLIFLQTMKATDGIRLKSIRRFIFGGEGYPLAKLKQLYDAYRETARFFNVYGPTECTCMCSSYEVTIRDFADLQGLPPLGKIAANFSYEILFGGREASSGELCLSGPQVGLGYYNDPIMTAQNFMQNPLKDELEDRMYRTGDLVEERKGLLYFRGRVDNQVKHMGYRIELEEIEAALNCLTYVSEAGVVHSNSDGLSQLIAIIATETVKTDHEIRLDLHNRLPSYMTPTSLFRLPELPKNANGKIDRKLLKETYG